MRRSIAPCRPRHASGLLAAGALLAASGLGCTTKAPEANPPTAPGPPDPGALAAPPPPPAAPCAPALFCDDFEDDAVGTAPGAPWRDETGPSGATVRVDSLRAHSGKNSVHVLAPKGARYRRGYFALHGAPVFPAAALELYGRAMVWLDAAPLTPPGAHDVHWTLLQGEGRSRDDRFNSIYRYGGQHQKGLGLMANFETTPPVRSESAGAAGSQSRKVEPTPTSLRACTSPPMSRARRRLMASPSPVPPCARVSVMSPCTNGSKIGCSQSAGIPVPVSSTRT